MTQLVDPCPMCGTWVCDKCGWRRVGANRLKPVKHDCHKCGSTEGIMLDIHHQRWNWRYQDHKQEMKYNAT